MVEIPEELFRRSAEARAAADGRPVEEVIAEWRGEAAPPAAPQPAEPPVAAAPVPTDPPPAEDASSTEGAPSVTGLPEHLLIRSAEAKARASGRPVDEILAELKSQPAPAAPVAAPVAPAAAPEPAPAAPAAAPTDGPLDMAAAAAAAGMPEKLFTRSVEAKAKATGRTVADIVAEMTGITAGPAPADAASAVAVATAPAPAPAIPPIPEGTRTQRLLTVVKAKSIQKVKSEPTDKVSVWPHLLAIEFVALLVITALLIIFSVFQDAPLLELANPNEQPNPSKAPWYFLGLQELLAYFDPQIAGVLIPGMGLAGLALIPYIDRNPATKPSLRKYAIMVFTFFVMAAAILTIIGSFYRGPGFNFTFPWRDGIFFDL